MSTTPVQFAVLSADLLDLEATQQGETSKLFAPTAARCSSSSSTCCYGCIRFRR